MVRTTKIEANLFGVVNVTRAALPVLRTQRSGTFVQFSSVGGRVGGPPGMGAYQTAKFAVEGFSEVLANEVKPFGIRVLIVEPGGFRTDWQGSSMRAARTGSPGIIVDIVRTPQPPRRLLLGAQAVVMAREAAAVRAAELEQWADISRAADFPSEQ